ncbi:unnamed protein product, partial [Ectocarpus sp. 12 AP-2014]
AHKTTSSRDKLEPSGSPLVVTRRFSRGKSTPSRVKQNEYGAIQRSVCADSCWQCSCVPGRGSGVGRMQLLPPDAERH